MSGTTKKQGSKLPRRDESVRPPHTIQKPVKTTTGQQSGQSKEKKK